MEKSKLLPDSYLLRYAFYNLKNGFRQTFDDYRYFPVSTIAPSTDPFSFKQNPCEEAFPTALYRGKDGPISEPLAGLLERSGTTAFLIIKNDEILYERYLNGADSLSVSRFFSATKSVLSALVGIAIDDGLIKNPNQSVTDFLPELKPGGFDRFTIQNLLNMDSGIPFDGGFFPWSLQTRQYFSANIRQDISRLKLTDPIADSFHYNDWHPEILALVLERATGLPVGRFLEDRLWKPIGAESPALLVLDSEKDAFTKMESGLAGRALDLAKFGRLYLNSGCLEGRRILSEKWIGESVSPEGVQCSATHFRRYDRLPWGNWFRTGNAFYKNMWWGYKTGEDRNDYFAMGVLGQILYVSPRKKMILVRLGRDWGFSGWWPSVLKQLADGCQ